MDNLSEVMNMIINEQPLPPERCNHPLKGEWKDSYGCHIQGDWVLIYEPEYKAHTVISIVPVAILNCTNTPPLPPSPPQTGPLLENSYLRFLAREDAKAVR